MEETKEHLTVLFADICSSTSYFKQYGDAGGRRIVTDCLERVSETVKGLGGRIIDRIGDEVLCTLPDLGTGLRAGPAIQEAVAEAAAAGDLPDGIRMRIGFHFGHVVAAGDRIYGDTIHTAKRLVDLAKCDQILTSQETLAAASALHAPSSRFVDRVRIKGQREPLEIFELLRETTDLTQVAAPLQSEGEHYRACLLRYGHQELVVNESRPVLTVGRAAPCDLVIPQSCVSRQHGRVEYQKGRIIYIDQSTNGTFLIEHPSQESIRIRREQRWLRNSGSLRFGQILDDEGDLTVVYVCL